MGILKQMVDTMNKDRIESIAHRLIGYLQIDGKLRVCVGMFWNLLVN